MAKFATKESSVSRLLRKSDATLNYEGSISFIHDEKHTLATMAACCLVNERAFYEDTTEKIDELVRYVGRQDPEWLVKLAIYIRNELHLRSMPTRIAAIAVTIPECRKYLLVGANRILTRPDDLLEFAAILKDNRYGLTKTLPSLAKIIIADGLNQLDEIRAIKYRRGESFGLKHLLKISHPVPVDDRQNLLFSYLLDPSRWNKMRQDQQDLLPKITAYETLKLLPKKHYQKKRQIVRHHALPWELVLPQLGSNTETWKIIAPVMPIMALTRNLRNLVKSGALKSPMVQSSVIEKLSNPGEIRNSKMFPFRWLSAKNQLQKLRKQCSNAEIITKLEKALNSALEISTECLPNWPGRTAIACDLSGSMSCYRISQYSSISPKTIAAVLSAIAHRLCDDHVIYAFGSDIARLSLDPNQSMLENAERIEMTNVGFATFGYKVIEDLVKNKDFVTRIVVMTDMELYSEIFNPADSEDIRLWIDRYKREVNPDVEIYFVNLAAYGHFVTPQCEPNVTYISGWSEGILKYITATSPGFNLVDEISRVVL